MKKYLAFPVVLIMLASLVGCNLPSAGNPTETPISIDAAYTAAAETVEAQFTTSAQTQAAATPIFTNTPLAPTNTTAPTAAAATSTPLPKPVSTTQTCDVGQFVTDVTVPDNTNFNAGDAFVKTWRIKNTGTCSWTPSYALVFASDSQMDGPSTVALTGNVNPGETVDLSVNLKAPSKAGTYTGNWKVRNAAGLAFAYFYVKINVGGSVSVTNTPGGPTSTPGKFAVTSVSFTDTDTCSNFTVIAKIQVNGAGTVSYHWVRSDDNPLQEVKTLEFSDAGSQSVSMVWDIVDSGTKWVELYIDEPNHQQFGTGRAEITCP